MPLDIRDKDELVENVIAYLEENLDFEIDTSEGEPIRTILEAIMLELDYQYWQLEQTYNNSFIDTASNEELSELVKILGIEREPSIPSAGRIRFSRETPATEVYEIPAGTVVGTMPDSSGAIVQFATLEDLVLLQDETILYADVECTTPGRIGNVPAGRVVVINNPPRGIEDVINEEAIVGGEEEESDDELRERAKTILETVGLGTIDAIVGAIDKINGVRSVSAVDLARGINTADILVLGDITPLPQEKIAEITNIANTVKPAGVDVLIKEPFLVSQDINVNIFLRDSSFYDFEEEIINTIEKYINDLDIGEPLILNQLRKEILLVDDAIFDINMVEPLSNIVINSNEVIRTKDIIVNRVV